MPQTGVGPRLYRCIECEEPDPLLLPDVRRWLNDGQEGAIEHTSLDYVKHFGGYAGLHNRLGIVFEHGLAVIGALYAFYKMHSHHVRNIF